MKKITDLIQPDKWDRDERVFRVPEDYDGGILCDALAAWIGEHLTMTAATVPVDEGWLVQADDTTGILGRLVHRKASSLYVRLWRREDGLHVRLGHGRWAKDPAAVKARGAGFWDMASAAVDAGVEMAEAAASGVSDLLVETRTAEMIFHFISERVSRDLRARSGGTLTGIDPGRSRYMEPLTDVAAVWLAGFREPGEILLAWLGTSTPVEGHGNAEWHYLLTTRRAALAALSPEGFIEMKALPGAAMTVSDEIGRDMVRVGEFAWRTQLLNDGLFREIAPLSDMGPGERIHAAARLNFIHREKQKDRAVHALELLDYGLSRGPDPMLSLSRLYASGILAQSSGQTGGFKAVAGELRDIACALPERYDGKQIREWADAWALGPWERVSLSGTIQRCPRDPSALAEFLDPMLGEARRLVLKKDRDPGRQAVADIVWARHLSHMNRTDEAVRLLEERLSKLPDETLSDLLPLRDTDLTRGEGGQLMKVWILEALTALRGRSDRDDVETLRELAVLQPLVDARMMQLQEAARGGLKRRASRMMGVLSAGMADAAETAVPGTPRPLEPDMIEARLRHPAGREGTVLRKVGQFLATGKTPDHSALKSYARRISSEKAPALSRSILDGVLVLGMPALEGYISFGDLDTGIRGYDGKPPFLLIGGSHVEPGSPAFMTPGELRFLIGGELAHIRFKHERITSREVWEGTFDKAMTLVELVPVLGTYIGKIGRFGQIAGRATDMAKKVGNMQNYINQARDIADSAQSLLAGKDPDAADTDQGALSQDEQNLISTFRVMQLTADRSGLLLCGDVGSAVRAIFKSCPTLVPELPLAEDIGLSAFLSRTDERGEMMYQDLAIRLAALFSFSLSREYESLDRAAFARS